MKEDFTPAMKQYLEIKSAHPDSIVLFRMGDFYETFFDDAKIVSEVLQIVLTKRGTKGGSKIPLAGIPYHAIDNYLGRLVKAGKRVVIVEQLENPKFAKGVVKRGVTRIVTPGTLYEADLLDSKSSNYIMAISPGDISGVAIADISTGEFFTFHSGLSEISGVIEKYKPVEIILPDSYKNDTITKSLNNKAITFYSDLHFLEEESRARLLSHFNVSSLKSFDIEDKPRCISASGALISYLKQTHETYTSLLTCIKHLSQLEYLVLDSITLRNLEIFNNIKDNSKEGTLIKILDNTYTPMGARLLRQWLLCPLIDIKAITLRVDAVEELLSSILIRTDVIESLRKISDVIRIAAKVANGTVVPRELISLSNSLKESQKLSLIMKRCKSSKLASMVFPDTEEITTLITSALNDSCSSISDGNVIKNGYNKELDMLRDLVQNGKKYIAELEEKERAMTGIKSLKIGFNRVFGYYFEISKPNLKLVPAHYIRKQTIVNGERFVTQELKEWESKILGAEEKIEELEQTLFAEVVSKVSAHVNLILTFGAMVAEVDCLQSLAEAALQNNYKRPFVSNSFAIKIKGGRHPVLERNLKSFVANDVHLDVNCRLIILTGPNMAGKSTFMRQVALTVIMAQIGSFVPAEEAEIGVVDRIFTRVGAYDDISHGQSSFMVEMTEVALILNNATENSLIIMDEIGRGTSTYDGMSIAWSVAEYIAKKIRAKCLFATHYHILAGLEKQPGVKNFHSSVLEKDNEITFLHRILPGWTEKSYGIHVAKLSGMPKEVIERAQEIQFTLETDSTNRDKVIVERRIDSTKKEKSIVKLSKSQQLTLFDVV
ncbi:MAG: DNA mismatch repair protein MutS [Candidatus Woesearchaeota archaeon]